MIKIDTNAVNSLRLCMMRQLSYKKGKVTVDNVPPPIVGAGTVLVDVAFTTISTGTEVSGVSSSAQNILLRAMQHPDQVRIAAELAVSQGLRRVQRMVKTKTQQSESYWA